MFRLLAATGAARAASAAASACSSSSASYSSNAVRATTVLCVRKGDQVKKQRRASAPVRTDLAPPTHPLLLQGRVHTHTRVRAPAPAPAPAPDTASTYPSLTHCMAKVVVIADGQVTRGSEVVKPNVRKVRRLGGGAAIGGFAGATADAFTLWERLEQQLEAHPGQLTRAAVELAKAWRSDKFLRRLDATMVVADGRQSLTITGGGDVLEPHDGVLAVGSGAPYALAAARALVTAGPPGMDALAIGAWFYVLFSFLPGDPTSPCRSPPSLTHPFSPSPHPFHPAAKHAMNIAADACIYTNHNFVIETMESTADTPGDGGGGGGGGSASPATPPPAAAKKGKAAAAS